MSNTISTDIQAPLRSFMQTLFQQLGIDGVSLVSKKFKMTLESPDGQRIFAQLMQARGGAFLVEATKLGADLVVPEGGAADLDGETGTTTLVASSKVVTVTPPAEGGAAVPVGSLVYAIHTTPAGVAKPLTAVRTDDDTITISSIGDGYAAKLDSTGVDGTLVAGHKDDIALANVAGDLLAVKEKTAGGSAADHYSIVRVSNTLVKVQAHDAAGALVAGNTAVVTAHNFGQKGHDTSLVRWVVIRP